MLADTVIELLKEEISSLEYDRYIKQLKFHEKASNSDQMVFLAPNILIANWVRTKYSDKIAHLFELKTVKKPEVKIVLKEHLKTTKTKSTPTEMIDAIKSTKNCSFAINFIQKFSYLT